MILIRRLAGNALIVVTRLALIATSVAILVGHQFPSASPGASSAVGMAGAGGSDVEPQIESAVKTAFLPMVGPHKGSRFLLRTPEGARFLEVNYHETAGAQILVGSKRIRATLCPEQSALNFGATREGVHYELEVRDDGSAVLRFCTSIPLMSRSIHFTTDGHVTLRPIDTQ
jgi:hypothetical protein